MNLSAGSDNPGCDIFLTEFILSWSKLCKVSLAKGSTAVVFCTVAVGAASSLVSFIGGLALKFFKVPSLL